MKKNMGTIDKVVRIRVKDGTAIGIGLATAINLIRNSTLKHKCIILLTDGRNNTGEIDPISSAVIAKTSGIRLYIIGIGGKDSALFPFKTPKGMEYQKLPTEIDDNVLKSMSSITHGRYFRAYSKHDILNFFKEINTIEKNNAATDEKLIPDNNTISENPELNSIQPISIKVANRVLNAVEINEFMVNEKRIKERVHQP